MATVSSRVSSDEAWRVTSKRAQEAKAGEHEYQYRVVLVYEGEPNHPLIIASKEECENIAKRRNDDPNPEIRGFKEAYVEKQKITYGEWSKA